MTRQRTTRTDRPSRHHGHWRLVAAGALAALTVGGLGAPALAAPPDAEGLVIGYPEGPLQLAGLAPGLSREGYATVTNYRGAALSVDLAAWLGTATGEPAAVPAGLTLAAEVCRQAWRDGACAAGAMRVGAPDAPAGASGRLGPDETWYVRVVASLATDAGNDTRDRTVPFVVRLRAVETSSPNGDIDDSLADTGSDVWPVGTLAAALVAAGGALVLVRSRLDTPARPRR